MPTAARSLAAVLVLLSAGAARAQDRGGDAAARPDGSRAGPCEQEEWGRGDDGRGWACERRTFSIAARREVRVDGGANGGVSVRGADTVRAPLVVAVVTARGRTDADAARLAADVRVLDDGGTLRARGPRPDGDAQWSVSWRVFAPRRTDVDVRTNNGGARAANLVGRLRLDTRNGGIRLDSVGGAVVARSSNGGVRATLAGRAWESGGLADAGLDLHSDNGGAVLRVPDDYSARVSVGTNNGPLAVEFPVTVQGRVDPRRIELTRGAGGAPVRVTTNNGGARLGRVP